MTDNEIIVTVAKIFGPVQDKIDEMTGELTEMKGELTEMKGELTELNIRMKKVEDKIEEEIVPRLKNVEDKLEEVEDTLETEVLPKIKKIDLTQECLVLPRLNNIEACYTSTFERYKLHTEEYESIKKDVDIVMTTVNKHSEILQKIS